MDFPNINATRSEKRQHTQQKRTGAGGAELLGSISLLGEIFGLLHQGC